MALLCHSIVKEMTGCDTMLTRMFICLGIIFRCLVPCPWYVRWFLFIVPPTYSSYPSALSFYWMWRFLQCYRTDQFGTFLLTVTVVVIIFIAHKYNITSKRRFGKVLKFWRFARKLFILCLKFPLVLSVGMCVLNSFQCIVIVVTINITLCKWTERFIMYASQ